MALTVPVYFHYHLVNFRLPDSSDVKLVLWKLFKQESKNLQRLDFILSSDAYLLELNQAYLQHDYFTDVITFDYSDQSLSDKERAVIGEVYISLDRVRENAKDYGVTAGRELRRVILHGALHLCGYNDSNKAQKAEMTAKEDYYLSLF